MLLVMLCWVLAMTAGFLWARRWIGIFTGLALVAYCWMAVSPGHLAWWLQLGVLGLTPWLPAASRTVDERLLKSLHAKEARKMLHLSEAARSFLSFQTSTQQLETQIADISDLYHVSKETSRALHLSELFAASLDITPRLLGARGLRLIDLSDETPQVLRAARGPDGRMVPPPVGQLQAGSGFHEPERLPSADPTGGGMVPTGTSHILEMEQVIIQQTLSVGRAASGNAQELSCPFPDGIGRVAWAPLWRDQRPSGILVADDLPEPQLKTLSIVANQLSLQLSRIHLYQQVEALAVTDALTGLSVRRYFLERAKEELVRSKRHDLACTLLMADLDLFKHKNDTYGHLVGDVVLRDVAHLLKRNLRDIDLIARFGGEEFILLLIETDVEQALPIAERLRQLVEVHPIKAYDELLTQTISMGVAGFPQDAQTLDALIEQADQALYAAKGAGRNHVVRWTSQQAV